MVPRAGVVDYIVRQGPAVPPAEKEGQRGNSSISRALKGRFYAGDLSLQGREEIFTFTDKRNGPVLLHRSSGGNIVHILFYCISWNLQGGPM